MILLHCFGYNRHMAQRPDHMDQWQADWDYFLAALFERLELESPKEADVQPRIDAVFNKATNNELWQAATHAWTLRNDNHEGSAVWNAADQALFQSRYFRETAEKLQR